MNYDVIVAGAGFSGLIAAAKAGENGKKVLLISKGQGDVHLTSGCVDILACVPGRENVCSVHIEKNLQLLTERMPEHPYAKVGLATIKESIAYFRQLTKSMGYAYQGGGIKNYLLATGMGTVRPAALVPETMAEGDVREPGNVLVLGFRELIDFHPKLIADRLNLIRSQWLKVAGKWSGKMLSLGIDTLGTVSPLKVARWLENDGHLDEFISVIKDIVPVNTKLGLPAILGSHYSTDIFRRIRDSLGCPVFEIPFGQPTVSGLRLYNLLLAYVKQCGVRVQLGLPVFKVEINTDCSAEVLVNTPGRPTGFGCRQLIIATGGLYGKGLACTARGIKESILDLPVIDGTAASGMSTDWNFFDRTRHPYSTVGVVVDRDLRPVAVSGPVNNFTNIKVVGRSLAGYDPVIEKNGLGVALATGFAAGKAVAGGD